MKRYLITLAILLIAVIGGFTLPLKLLKWQDGQRVNAVEIYPSEKVLLTAQTNMTLIEKLCLMKNEMAAVIEMADGKNYTAEEMIVQTQKELKVLSELGIIELERLDLVYGVEDILFFVDVQGGTQSMLLWKMYALTEDGILRMSVDDETGKILTLTCTEGNGTVSVSISSDSIAAPESDESVQKPTDSGQLNVIAQKWAEYLEIQLIETSVFDRTITSGYEDMQKEIDQLVEKGLDKEEAAEKIYEEWGYADEEFLSRRIYATYEDESGIVVYGFRRNTGNIIFSADVYM